MSSQQPGAWKIIRDERDGPGRNEDPVASADGAELPGWDGHSLFQPDAQLDWPNGPRELGEIATPLPLYRTA